MTSHAVLSTMVTFPLLCSLSAPAAAQHASSTHYRDGKVCWITADSFTPVVDAHLEHHLTRLQATYSARTEPSGLDHVEPELTLDRSAVFHAGVRAMFTPISAERHRAGGIDIGDSIRVIDFVEEITAIWGARPGDTNGRHQFRLSIRFQPGLEEKLSGSLCFSADPDRYKFGHVILPGVGDDANLDSTPTVTTTNVASYRAFVQICGININFASQPCTKKAASPLAVQINFLKDDPTVGEFDIDFDEGPLHGKPSNSDPLARGRGYKGENHWHLDMLNIHFRFRPTLHFYCGDHFNHGQDSYDSDKNCIHGRQQ